MAEFKQASADAPVSEKALTWIDNRFPLSKLWNDQPEKTWYDVE